LKQQLGVIGSQLFATAWGIDRAQVMEPTKVKEASLGNSQVLPRDYFNQVEIETVIKEIGEQVAARLRHHHKLAGCLSLSIGFSYAAAEADGRGGFHQALKIDPTNDNQVLTQQLLWLFRQNWDGQAVRNIGVYSSKLSSATGQQLNLFETSSTQIRHSQLNQVIDEIHRQFGFTKLVYA
ncbi:DinB/UmuC family translesion DNA polymerase, partial [Lactiplantibacillus plantarum]|uniref:DinB/UmuC family translesion DNA polymerase n=3 Tax=Lactiplantibacillus plantarum TaxID=1590 RepID=UPI003EE8021E